MSCGRNARENQRWDHRENTRAQTAFVGVVRQIWMRDDVNWGNPWNDSDMVKEPLGHRMRYALEYYVDWDSRCTVVHFPMNRETRVRYLLPYSRLRLIDKSGRWHGSVPLVYVTCVQKKIN